MFVPPGKIQKVDPDHVREALLLYSGISAGKVSTMKNPKDIGVRVVDHDGSITSMVFTDHDINRFGVLMKEKHQDKEHVYFMSLMLRVLLFPYVMKFDGMEKWVRASDDDNYDEIHPAIIDVLSRQPLTVDGEFEAGSFLAEIESVAQAKYRDI